MLSSRSGSPSTHLYSIPHPPHTCSPHPVPHGCSRALPANRSYPVDRLLVIPSIIKIALLIHSKPNGVSAILLSNSGRPASPQSSGRLGLSHAFVMCPSVGKSYQRKGRMPRGAPQASGLTLRWAWDSLRRLLSSQSTVPDEKKQKAQDPGGSSITEATLFQGRDDTRQVVYSKTCPRPRLYNKLVACVVPLRIWLESLGKPVDDPDSSG